MQIQVICITAKRCDFVVFHRFGVTMDFIRTELGTMEQWYNLFMKACVDQHMMANHIMANYLPDLSEQ